MARLTAISLGIAALAACARQSEGGDVPPDPVVAVGGQPARYSYEVRHVWPHDPGAFTQGLVYREGDFLESTGLYGESSLRDVDPETGRVLKEVTVPQEYFAEGLAVVGDKAYQLTWRNGLGFIYDVSTFRKEGEFHYEGEGWGLTTDGRLLVMSDGTSRIRFIDPAHFSVVRTIDVTVAGRPVSELNELEWIKGEIFANVWRTDEIVRIDPQTGAVRGEIDLADVLPWTDRTRQTDVMNGIAYDEGKDRLFITGKKWPKLFEVRLKPASQPPQ
jgi:glutamine cyclotransferase